MKYTIGILTTVILIAAFVLSGCDRPSNDRMQDAEVSVIESNRDLEIAKAEVEAEYRIYKLENENRLVRYNRTIEGIKQDISSETDRDAKAMHETRLERYETNHSELKRELDNYRVSGRENWSNFKDSYSNRMDDLGDSLDDFFSTRRTTTSSTN